MKSVSALKSGYYSGYPSQRKFFSHFQNIIAEEGTPNFESTLNFEWLYRLHTVFFLLACCVSLYTI